tara:strand:- start:107 stop:406 length:300 start_codon:yes stop_codon:yes gene_type:complete
MNKSEAMNVIWRIIDDYCENCINDSEDKNEEMAHIHQAMDIIYEGLGFEKVTDSKGRVYYYETGSLPTTLDEAHEEIHELRRNISRLADENSKFKKGND